MLHQSLRWTITNHSRPLHGLPILIKNNIGTDDKMQTNGMSSLINIEHH